MAYFEVIVTRLLIYIIVIFTSRLSAAEFVLSRELLESYRAIIALDLPGARTSLETDRVSNPQNGFHPLIENYADFLSILIDGEKNTYTNALQARSIRLGRLKLADQSSPYFHYCLGEFYLQWALMRFKSGDTFSAGMDLRSAFHHFERNSSRFPSFILNGKGMGVLHALAGAVPDNYKWLAKIAGISGTLHQGIAELQTLESRLRVHPQLQVFRTEVLFYILFIQRNSDLELITDLPAASLLKDQLLLRVARAMLYQKNQNSRGVLTLLKDFPPLKGLNFCYIDYMRGEASLNLQDYNAAEVYLNQFLSCNTGDYYRKAALRKLAWIDLLKGSRDNYLKRMYLVKGVVRAPTEDDKQADEEAQNGVPDPLLLEARILFDGGSFERVITMLSTHRTRYADSSLVRRVELDYRLARAWHKTGNHQKAAIVYEKVMNEGRNLKEYFAASSAYQMGLIEQKAGNIPKAIAFFKNVSGFPGHPYKNSLDAKAKAAIRSLN